MQLQQSSSAFRLTSCRPTPPSPGGGGGTGIGGVGGVDGVGCGDDDDDVFETLPSNILLTISSLTSRRTSTSSTSLPNKIGNTGRSSAEEV